MGPWGRQIAPLCLRQPSGARLCAYDFRHRRNLVVVLLGATCVPCRQFLRSLSEQHGRLRELEAVVLAAYLDQGAESVSLPEGFFAGEAAAAECERWLGPGAHWGVFVADRYGDLYACWRGSAHEALPSVEEVIARVEQAEFACEECGVCDWPL